MTHVIIVHGTYGHPKENWIPWLQHQLEDLGCQVTVPSFPTPEGQELDEWFKVFKKYESKMDSETILIGHSLGASFLLSVLERLKRPVKATFLVAGFASQLETPTITPLLRTFVEKEFDWEKIRANSQYFCVFQSDDDPFVPFEKAGELARNLHTEITIVQGAGHFSERAGYTQFELLLDRIKEAL